MTELEHIRDILPRVVSRLGGTMQDDVSMDSYHRLLDDHRVQTAIKAQGRELAEAVRAYQAALNDPTYWTEPLGQSQQRVSEAFDRMVALTNQILEGA